MAKAKEQIISEQTTLDFDRVKWPDQEGYPLNIKGLGRNVQTIIYGDIDKSQGFLIVTGFTSLSNLIDLFGSKDHAQLKKVRVLIGFEPNVKGRKVYSRFGLDKEIKDYWIKRGLSILQGGAVMQLIEKINNNWIEFRFRDKLHAKLYIGNGHATIGSSNFSRNGLNFQEEANVRFANADATRQPYKDVKLIAESYYEDSLPYNEKLISLLTTLISDVVWQEALARAMAEMLEGNWLDEYKEIMSRMSSAKLWPTQWKGLTQAVSILQNTSNVLIADPTGAGKTKLCTSIVLCLQHLLYEKGKHHRTESLIICPPLVMKKWAGEFRSFGKLNNNQISMGMLSKASAENQAKIAAQLKLGHLLVIDEAHSFLADSDRTAQIKTNRADYKLLITATPISRKVEDVLSISRLLDVDNLSDEEFKVFLDLLKRPYNSNQQANVSMLREFISRFTIRRTKKKLNEEIEKERDAYKNVNHNICKFPKQVERTYETRETEADKAIVRRIGDLCLQLKGITYLTGFELNEEDAESDDSNLKIYVDRRLVSARGLSIHVIRYKLRSSHVALLEHIEGSKAAMDHFEFTGKTNHTGNKLARLRDIRNKAMLPHRQKKFADELFPDWLIDEALYVKACEEELSIYQNIAALAKQLSGSREQGKVDDLNKASKKHPYLLAFDSTVITIYYLKKLFRERYPEAVVLVATGGENDQNSQKIMDIFKIDAVEQKGRVIALCSDKMSESVDLQKASCVFLLDIPGVLRIVEQRIGRADRMDSVHKEIEIYWAFDSEEYSLKGDDRLIETNRLVEMIFGSNFQVPEALKGRRFQRTENMNTLIEEYKEFVDKDESWTGIEDRFQTIRSLKEGPDALISEQIYQLYTNVTSEVKAKVSFIAGSGNWCFIALRGDHRKSPRWYFIKANDHIEVDIGKICGLLREYISNKSVRLKWDAPALERYVRLFKAKERELLPYKKGRALEVAEYILRKRQQEQLITAELREAMKLIQTFLQGKSTEIVDYEILADEWIMILQPYLNAKREQIKKKRKVEYNLNSLRRDHRNINFTAEDLYHMAEQCVIADAIDKRIAACIIAVSNDGQ
ncbi:SNF2-related protein [Mucilaginibacter sp. CAU 1740]|uniref:SNF2-related protein n=1 Tax=Mucilaginibacter sp. CAU 1740 TaxID=3140365 RepID=UPI00325AB8A5